MSAAILVLQGTSWQPWRGGQECSVPACGVYCIFVLSVCLVRRVSGSGAFCRFATNAVWRSQQRTSTGIGPTPTACTTTARSALPPTASGGRQRCRPSSSAWQPLRWAIWRVTVACLGNSKQPLGPGQSASQACAVLCKHKRLGCQHRQTSQRISCGHAAGLSTV